MNGKSILAVDFGSVRTRALLFDVVENTYRLVARSQSRTTDSYPADDLSVGMERVLNDITEATGRAFLDATNTVITPARSDGTGIDLFAITASIGRPLRAVVIGLVPSLSIASAVRAASGTYIEVVNTVSLEDGRDMEGRLNAILLSYPDVVIIAGGTEGGATQAVVQLAETVRLAVSLLQQERRPSVVYTGNSVLNTLMTDLFAGVSPLLLAENVRPNLRDEHLDSVRMQLNKAFDRVKEYRNRSFATIGKMSQTGVLPTGQSYSILADFIGKTTGEAIALVDVGSSTSTLAASMDARVVTSIRTDLGLGQSAPMLLETVEDGAIAEWLPFEPAPSELSNYALNKSLRPATIPQSLRELFIEQAFLKAGTHNLIVEANAEWASHTLPFDRVIAAGAAFTGTGHPAYDALLILDAVQPTGVTVLQSDPYGLIAGMGAIASHVPEAVIQLIDGDSFWMLGTCISAGGTPRLDRPALILKITPEGEDEAIEQTVMGGHLWVYPLPAGQKAEVYVKTGATTSINGQRSVKLTVEGGQVGLIFDARGRPIVHPADLKQRGELMTLWVEQMTGDPQQAIDPRWLAGEQPLMDEAFATLAEQAPAAEARTRRKPRAAQGRRGLFGRKRNTKDAQAALPIDEPGFDDLDDLLEENDDDLDELRRDVLS